MKITRDDLIPILYQFNPWWKGEDILDLENSCPPSLLLDGRS